MKWVLPVAIVLVIAGVWLAAMSGGDPRPLAGWVGFLRVAIPAAPFLALFWLGAAGFGSIACRTLRVGASCDCPILLRLAVGQAVMLLLDWLLLLAGWMNWLSAAALCVVGGACLLPALLASRRLRDVRAPVSLPRIEWAAILPCIPAGVLLFAAACPAGTLWKVEAFGYDVLSYHLQLPREWLANGRMTGLHHNVFSYFPNLAETGYAQLWAMTNGLSTSVYAAQGLHATTTILAALCAGSLVRRVIGRDAGHIAAALFLAMPWNLITGSMAYDEMFTLLFGGAAIALAFNSDRLTWRDAACAGFLAGTATLAKLPAGPMIAVPIGLAVAWRAWCGESEEPAKPQAATGDSPARSDADHAPTQRSASRGLALAALAAIAGAITLAPYLVRNAAWTGNPVFPFAARSLGSAHWGAWQVDRWNDAVHAHGSAEHRLSELGRRWLFNTGFGAVGDFSGKHADANNAEMAKFTTEWGAPVFWLAALAGAAAMLAMRRARPLAAFMLLTLAVQIVFWLTSTHLQSRFLVATTLPGCVLAAGLLAEPMRRIGKAFLWRGVSVALVACLVLLSVGELGRQTRGIQTGFLPGALPDAHTLRNATENTAFYHPVSTLPRGSKVLLVGDVTWLAYFQTDVEYATAFDRNPLATRIADAKGQSRAVTETLQREGFTHVWISWSELARIKASFGAGPDASPERIAEIVRNAAWRVVYDQPGVTLFELR